MADSKDIMKLTAILSAGFPNFTPNEYTLEVYLEDLKDVPPDDLFAAVTICRTEAGRKFAPSTGEIRGAVAEMRRAISGIPDEFEAWSEVMNARPPSTMKTMRDGQWVEPEPYKWPHEIVGIIAVRLGWPRFPSGDNEAVDRAHFFKAYNAEIQRLLKHETMPDSAKAYIEGKRNELLLDVQPEMKKLASKLETKNG